MLFQQRSALPYRAVGSWTGAEAVAGQPGRRDGSLWNARLTVGSKRHRADPQAALIDPTLPVMLGILRDSDPGMHRPEERNVH